MWFWILRLLKPAAHKARFVRFFPAASTLHAIWRRSHEQWTQQATNVRQCSAWGIATWKSHVWCGFFSIFLAALSKSLATMRTSRKFSIRPQSASNVTFSRRNASCAILLHVGYLLCACAWPLRQSRAMYLRQGKTARNALCVQPALRKKLVYHIYI